MTTIVLPELFRYVFHIWLLVHCIPKQIISILNFKKHAQFVEITRLSEKILLCKSEHVSDFKAKIIVNLDSKINSECQISFF